MKLAPFFIAIVVVFSSCKVMWSDEDKDAFYQACSEGAMRWAGSPEKTKAYCDCVFQRMVKKYPQEEDALEHLDSLAKDPDLIKCRDEIESTK